LSKEDLVSMTAPTYAPSKPDPTKQTRLSFFLFGEITGWVWTGRHGAHSSFSRDAPRRRCAALHGWPLPAITATPPLPRLAFAPPPPHPYFSRSSSPPGLSGDGGDKPSSSQHCGEGGREQWAAPPRARTTTGRSLPRHCSGRPSLSSPSAQGGRGGAEAAPGPVDAVERTAP
jgi:hypothetical protein